MGGRRLLVLPLDPHLGRLLIEGEDLLPEPLDEATRQRLDKDFPRELAIGDARYRITYDVARRRATLHQVFGARKTPPPDGFLPRLPGWTLVWEHKNRERVIRRR